jgi:5-methylcytosine-specific restriction protein A
VRRNFPDSIKLAAFERSGGHCEKCTAPLCPGKFRHDHRIPDWMGGEPTLENCWLLCDACDRTKTSQDQRNIAKSRRIRKRHAGIRRDRSIRGWRNYAGEPVSKPRQR